MKFLSLLFLSILLTVSCTKKANQEDLAKNSANDEQEYIANSFDIIVSQTDFPGVLPDIANTETVLFRLTGIEGKEKKARFYVRNQSGATLNLVDFSNLTTNTFEVKSNRCRSTLAPGRSCYVDLRVVYTAGVGDSTEKLYFLQGKSVEDINPRFDVVINVDEDYVAEVSSEGDAIQKSQSLINFGTLSVGETSTRRLYFYNTHKRRTYAPPTLPTMPTGITVVNNCGTEIAALSNCFVEFTYAYQGQQGGDILDESNIALASDNMAEIEKTVYFQAYNVEEADPNVPKLAFSETFYPISTVGGNSYVRRVYVSNAQKNDNYTFSDNNFVAGATVLKNTCQIGRTLKPGEYCYVDMQVDTAQNDDPILVDFNIPDANVTRQYSGGKPKYDSGFKYGSGVKFQ